MSDIDTVDAIVDTPPPAPRPPRRMLQPPKDMLRAELAHAMTTIEQLRAENDRLRNGWWRRLLRAVNPHG